MSKISIDLQKGAIKNDKKTIIGIDLGTSFSLVAYMDDKIPYIIKDKENDSKLIPSIIHFADHNEIIVGDKAIELSANNAERTIASIKRLMGKSYEDLDRYKSKLSYKIIDPKDDNKLVKISIDDKYYSPIELSAHILKRLKQNAERDLNTSITQAVITVPAYFNDTQRQATRDAGKLAGLDVLRIINEPTAASLAYGIGMKKDEEEKVVVFDLGGGTFDVSILHIEDGIFEVLATHGHNFLGGDDFDHKIIDFWTENNLLLKQIIQDNKQATLDIKLLAEKAKRSLSSTNIYSGSYNIDNKTIELSISKDQFETLITPLVTTTIDSCKKALEDSKLSTKDIDKIIMVGGSTRVPLVQEKVANFFDKQVYNDINPDEVVALGAAIQADILAGNNSDFLLLDISPLSLGIETIGGLMDVIIPRNSKIPVRFARNYTTSVDGQVNLKIAVYQGERDLVQDNRKLGEFVLRNIPPMAAGMPKIEIRFMLDVDGILTVKAKELRSDTEAIIEIKSAYGISEEEMGRMLMDSIKNAASDVEIKGILEAVNEGNHVLSATKKFLQQNKIILSQEEVSKIIALSEHLGTSIDKKDKDQINKDLETLNNYSSPLAQRAMDHAVSEALGGKKV